MIRNIRWLPLLMLAGVVTASLGQTIPATAPDDNEASPKQMRELMPLLEKVGYDRLGDLFAAQKEKEKKENWTKRQSVAWLIAETKKIAESDAKNGLPPVRTATGKFESPLAAVQFFSPTSGIAVTAQGIAVTDGSLDRWKGQMGWEHPMGTVSIVGATENQMYFVTVESKEVFVKEGFDPPAGMENDISLHRVTKKGKEVLTRYEYTFTLFHWTREAAGGKLQEIRKLPRGALYDSEPAACAFADEKSGGFIDGQKLRVTRDGGVTWVETALSLKPPGFSVPERVMQIAFSDVDHLLITSGGESIALLSLDKEGHAQQQWTQRIFGRFGQGSLTWPYSPPLAIDAVRKLVWVCSDHPSIAGTHMEAFNLADGKLDREFNPFAGKGENIASYSIAGDQMFTFGNGPHGGNLLRIWNLQKNPPEQSAEISGAITGAYAVPGKPTLYLAIQHQQLIEWNGRPEIPLFLTSDIQRPTVDNTLLAAAEEHWPPGPDASHKESAALMEARRGLTPAQKQQLLHETQEKAKDFDNERAQILWMTQRAIELKR